MPQSKHQIYVHVYLFSKVTAILTLICVTQMQHEASCAGQLDQPQTNLNVLQHPDFSH